MDKKECFLIRVTMATLTKKDLLEAIEDMPMDMPIKVEVHSQGFAYAYTPIIGCEIIDGWLVFKGKGM